MATRIIVGKMSDDYAFWVSKMGKSASSTVMDDFLVHPRLYLNRRQLVGSAQAGTNIVHNLGYVPSVVIFGGEAKVFKGYITLKSDSFYIIFRVQVQ